MPYTVAVGVGCTVVVLILAGSFITPSFTANQLRCSPLFIPDKRGLTPKRQALNSLEFLHGWAQNDLVNIHVSRLLNCEGDSSSDRFGGNCMPVDVHHEIATL